MSHEWDILLPEVSRAGPLMRATCCRDWPIFPYVPLRPCGLCGKVPVTVGPWEDK